LSDDIARLVALEVHRHVVGGLARGLRYRAFGHDLATWRSCAA